MEALTDLERVQTRILQRIINLELFLLPNHFSTFLPLSSPLPPPPTFHHRRPYSAILRSNGVKDFIFKNVPADYYDWPLEARRDVLGAASIHHLCKSIVLVNTEAPSDVTDCSNHNYPKYYVVVVQLLLQLVLYTALFNAESVKNFLCALNNAKIAEKKYNCKVILDEAIVKFNPDFFGWEVARLM